MRLFRSVLLLLVFASGLSAGLPESTLVLVDYENDSSMTERGVLYKQAGKLEYGDKVVSFSGKKLKSKKINCIVKGSTYSLVTVSTKSGDIVLTKNHLVFDPVFGAWIEAKRLTDKNFVLDINLKAVPVTGIKIKMLPKKVKAYGFMVKGYHCFFIIDSSGNRILVHNGIGAIFDSIKDCAVMVFEFLDSAPGGGGDFRSVLGDVAGPVALTGVAGYMIYSGIQDQLEKAANNPSGPIGINEIRPGMGYDPRSVTSEDYSTPAGRLTLSIAQRVERMKNDKDFHGFSDDILRKIAKIGHDHDVEALADVRKSSMPARNARAPIVESIAKSKNCDVKDVVKTSVYSEAYGVIHDVYETPNGNVETYPSYLVREINERRRNNSNGPGGNNNSGNNNGPEKPEFRANTVEHIFDGNKARGHYDKTDANMEKVLDLASDKSSFLGTDSKGCGWYSRMVDGAQEWCRTYGNKIVGAGKNPTPRAFNDKTGLCKPLKVK